MNCDRTVYKYLSGPLREPAGHGLEGGIMMAYISKKTGLSIGSSIFFGIFGFIHGAHRRGMGRSMLALTVFVRDFWGQRSEAKPRNLSMLNKAMPENQGQTCDPIHQRTGRPLAKTTLPICQADLRSYWSERDRHMIGIRLQARTLSRAIRQSRGLPNLRLIQGRKAKIFCRRD